MLAQLRFAGRELVEFFNRERERQKKSKTIKETKKLLRPKAGRWTSTRSAIEINPGVGGKNKSESKN